MTTQLSETAALPPAGTLPMIPEHVRAYEVPDLEMGAVMLRGQQVRTVTGIVVPYMTPTEISEVRGPANAPRIVSYREQFAPGALGRAVQVPNRVAFQLEHDDRLERMAGYGLEFRDSDSERGAIGVFALYPSQADRAVELLESSHKGLSITFRGIAPAFGEEKDGQLVTRKAVSLRAVAAVQEPAYAEAGVLAIRAAQHEAAAVQEQAEVQVRSMTEALQMLVDCGRELSADQQRWLADHGVTLRTA